MPSCFICSMSLSGYVLACSRSRTTGLTSRLTKSLTSATMARSSSFSSSTLTISSQAAAQVEEQQLAAASRRGPAGAADGLPVTALLGDDGAQDVQLGGPAARQDRRD